jgi:hypothetical protein
MRGGIGGVLDLTDDIRILRLRMERYMFGFYADGLIEILLVECVVLLIILAIGHVEPIIPSPRVQLRILLVRATGQPGARAHGILLEADPVLQGLLRGGLILQLRLRLILEHSLLLSQDLLLLHLYAVMRQVLVALRGAHGCLRGPLTLSRCSWRDRVGCLLTRIC